MHHAPMILYANEFPTSKPRGVSFGRTSAPREIVRAARLQNETAPERI